MRARADQDGLPPDHALRTLADEFQAAADGFFATPQACSVKGFVGAWTRARRTWCAYTGQPLV